MLYRTIENNPVWQSYPEQLIGGSFRCTVITA
jgi:hypothetical protein